MDINARINWKPGMELTAQTFLDLDANLDYRQQTAIRAALGEHCMGLLPGEPFQGKGMFYTNTFEIQRLQMTALLPSGHILQVDEPVSITIPLLYGKNYYLTVGLGDSITSFEKNGVSYVRPQYVYAIQTPEEVCNSDVFPITKFTVNEGTFSVDETFIPPCLMLSENAAFETYRQQYADYMRTLSEHKSLREGDGKRTMMRYLFMLRSYDMSGRVVDFIRFTHEIAQAIDYFIMVPNTEKPTPISSPVWADLTNWLQWFGTYLAGAVTLLDGIVLEDDAIDYEALLAQAKRELYEQLNPELYQKLLLSIKDELRQELSDSIREGLTNYITKTFRPDLEQSMGKQLHESLFEKLYTELFENLFNALYVPEPEEKQFMPTI